MVKQCLYCKKTFVSTSNRSFHIFPKDETIRRKWFEAINMDFEETVYIYLCSDHFSIRDFTVKYSGHRYLVTGAVPAVESGSGIINEKYVRSKNLFSIPTSSTSKKKIRRQESSSSSSFTAPPKSSRLTPDSPSKLLLIESEPLYHSHSSTVSVKLPSKSSTITANSPVVEYEKEEMQQSSSGTITLTEPEKDTYLERPKKEYQLCSDQIGDFASEENHDKLIETSCLKYCRREPRDCTAGTFPRDIKARRNWLNILGIFEGNVLKHDSICSDHFLPSDFTIKPGGNKYLKPDAVPSVSSKSKAVSCSKWAENVGRDDMKNKTSTDLHKNYKVCARHFSDDMFLNLSKDELRMSAVPTVFVNSREDEYRGDNRLTRGRINEVGSLFTSRNSQETINSEDSSTVAVPVLNLTDDLSDNVFRCKEEPEYFLDKSKSANTEMIQVIYERQPQLARPGGLRCRTCLSVISTQRYFLLMVMGHPSKTIKEMIIFCVPQMAPSLSDNDIICAKCLEDLELCVKFIENCLEVEEKIQSSTNGVSGYNSPRGDNLPHVDYVDMDHDYILKVEPIDIDDSQNWDYTQIEGVSQMDKEGLFKCTNCAKSFNTENCLLDHIRRLHNTTERPTQESNIEVPPTTQDPYFDIDDSILNDIEETILNDDSDNDILQRIEEKYQIVDPEVKCPFCDEILKLTKMESHLRQHHHNTKAITIQERKKIYRKRVLKCKTCLETFTSKDDLNLHLKIHPPFICEQCGKAYTLLSSLNAHKVSHNNRNAYICEFCGKGYKERNMLNCHRKIHENKKFTCEKCQKIFKTKLNLRNHVKNVHNSNYTAQCSQCGIVFKCRGSLKMHVRLLHLKLKPFKCEICEKEFGRPDYLRTHLRTHTGEPNKHSKKSGKRIRWNIKAPVGELLPCKFCGKRFEILSRLKWHLETHVRRFPCHFCPLTFARKQNRKRHELIHNGLEDFVRCNICWKRLKSKEELDAHIEIKHNNLKYTCHICGKKFHTIFLLNHHNSLEHNPADEINAKHIIYESLLEATGSNET